MITLSKITKGYKGQEVISNLDLTFEKGEITTILGASGCGKSTLLKLINKTIKLDGGSILIDGKNIDQIDEKILRRNIGYAIQSVGLFPHMTVRKNIEIVPRLLKWDREKINNRVDLLMKIVNLPEAYLNKYPIHLSGGEAQRVGVARALAADPEILLMDEPFGALDPATRRKLQNALLEIQSKLKKTILFVTHDITEAMYLADHVVIFKEDGALERATPFDIVNNSRELLQQFAGNSFVLDFLEKITLLEVKGYMKEVIDLSVSIDLVSANKSLKDVLSVMLLSGTDFVYTTINGKRYRFEFEALTSVIKGGNHV